MTIELKTVEDAARYWASTMDAFPREMIEKLMQAEPDAWHEITAPASGDRVYVYVLPDGADTLEHTGELVKRDEGTGLWSVELDDGAEITTDEDNFTVEHDDGLPMWGTMWSFHDSADTWWMEDGNGVESLSKCGFRVYEHDDLGFFFGIDGAGYNFYESHWIPLYKARGLQWHDVG